MNRASMKSHALTTLHFTRYLERIVSKGHKCIWEINACCQGASVYTVLWLAGIGIGTCKTMQALPRRLFNSVDELRGAVRSKEARLLGANSNVSLQAHGQNGWHTGLAGLGRG